jgi:hypothetical protein
VSLTAATGAAVVAELCILCCLLVEVRVLAALMLVGVVAIGAAFEAASFTWAATPFEAAAFCLAGVLFAIWAQTPPLLLALPVLVGGIALALGGGPVGEPGGGAGDLLVLNLPGTDTALAGADAAFVGAYGAWALRCGLRLSLTSIGLVGGLALAAATGGDLPALVPISAAFLLFNVDRLWTQFRLSP